MANEITPAYQTQLREKLEQLNEEELRTLCMDLGVDYENLGGRGKGANARELVALLNRNGRLEDLASRLSVNIQILENGLEVSIYHILDRHPIYNPIWFEDLYKELGTPPEQQGNIGEQLKALNRKKLIGYYTLPNYAPGLIWTQEEKASVQDLISQYWEIIQSYRETIWLGLPSPILILLAFIGVICSLVISIATNSIGQIRLIHILSGAFIFTIGALLTKPFFFLTNLSSPIKPNKSNPKLEYELKHHRTQLSNLQRNLESGIPLTKWQRYCWSAHQEKIAHIKIQLKQEQVPFKEYPIDKKIPVAIRLAKIIAIFRTVLATLLVIFFWSGFVSLLSMGVGTAYIKYLENFVTPIPTIIAASTPSITPPSNTTPTSVFPTTTLPSTTPTIPLKPTATPPLTTITPTSTPRFPPPESRLILWNINKGIDPEQFPTGEIFYAPDKYSSLKLAFTNMDYEVEISEVGISNLNLIDYKLVLVNLGWTWDTPYTQEEADALLNYVRQGGNLIIISDHQDTPNDHIQLLTEPLGIEIGGPFIGENLLEHLTDMSEHPIFTGVSDIILDHYSGELTIVEETFVVATAAYEKGSIRQIGIVALEVEQGKVIVMGDLAILHDTEIASGENGRQNLTFTYNILEWMLGSN